MRHDFQIRAVQLDLARQMEPFSFIREFIDFIAEHHYNTLLLYLEWRIRTRAVDLGENCSYSKAELQEIIAYAAAKKITVIPGIASLGHGDLLLKDPRYEHLSELRGGIPGRFPNADGEAIDLCPSLEEVRMLLKEYISECAEIFQDSPWIHIGADEVHNIGYCQECRPKALSYSDEGKLFLEHLLFVCSLVNNCSKRVMMWDDMLEFYPEILPHLPEDTVLVNWLYHDNVSGYRGHFFNQTFQDMLQKYKDAGLQYMIAPADYYSGNIASFTSYSQKYHPLGGVLTTWEKSNSLLYKSFPNIAFCGELWYSGGNSADEEVMQRVLRKIFPSLEKAGAFSALALYCSMQEAFPVVGMNDLTVFDFEGPDRIRTGALRTIIDTLSVAERELKTGKEKTILQDILFDCRAKLLKQESIMAGWLLCSSISGDTDDMLTEKLRRETEDHLRFYSLHRPRGSQEKLRRDTENWLSALEQMRTMVKNGFLKLLLMQPDYYAAPCLSTFVNGRKIASSTYKCGGKHLYHVCIPLPEDIKETDEISFEVTGFGSVGISFVSVVRSGRILAVPQEIVSVSGVVRDGGNILQEDINCAMLGTADVKKCYMDRMISGSISRLSLKMKQKFPCF